LLKAEQPPASAGDFHSGRKLFSISACPDQISAQEGIAMKARVLTILRVSYYVLLIAGISMLGYSVFVMIRASIYQAQAREQLSVLNARVGTISSASGQKPSPPHPSLRVGRGFAVIGRVEVPRIHLSGMVAEAANARALRAAIGHVPGTALPWQSGNVALVAHRDTFFRNLGELKVGDLIRLTVPGDRSPT
jgi:sortase A